MSQTCSDDLIRAAACGDQSALEQLLLTFYDPLRAHLESKIPRSLQSVLGVEDVLQDTFRQVFRDVRGFQSSTEAAFFAWLRTIADRRLLDMLKSLRRKKRGGQHRKLPARDKAASSMGELLDVLADSGSTPSHAAARREATHALEIALAALPNNYREAIRLRYLQGKSVEEVAAGLGCTPGATRGYLARGRQELRDALGRASGYLSRR
jgi:RNA polymerase sigma-70 factor, ECF subfamily